jgi:iron(III) transport system permease protein
VRVLLPIALPGLAAGWAMLFILSAGEVTASALLSSTSNPVIGRVMLDVSSFGSYPQVCALAIVITLVNAVFVLAVLRLARRGFDAALR